MAMYQGSATQGLRYDQTKEISLTIASFFHSCIIPAHNASAVVVRVVGEGDGVVSRSIRMGNSVRSVFVPWLVQGWALLSEKSPSFYFLFPACSYMYHMH